MKRWLWLAAIPALAQINRSPYPSVPPLLSGIYQSGTRTNRLVRLGGRATRSRA